MKRRVRLPDGVTVSNNPDGSLNYDQDSEIGRIGRIPPGHGFLYGEPCGEPARGGPCKLTLGHGGPHKP